MDSHSRERAPAVYVFNPLSEGRIAEGQRFTLGKNQELLARDLANLPQFLCDEDDVVLVPELPSVEFQRALLQAGFPIPEFVETERNSIRSNDPLLRRPIAGLRPWAWGADSLELFMPLFRNLSGELRSLGQCYNQRIACLYSKAWSANFLRAAMGQIEVEPWLCSEAEIGREADSLDAALEIVRDIRARGHHRVLVKQAYGLAGHNAIRLWEPKILESQTRWMTRALVGGRRLVVEPWLERLEDFSLQLEMGPGSLELRGGTGLVNDARGQFLANWAAPDCRSCIPGSATVYFRHLPDFQERLQRLYRSILSALQEKLRLSGYIGPVGIDAFVFRDASGQPRVKPVVEINPRYTMGRLTLELMKHAAPGAWGVFRLLNAAQIHAAGFKSFVAYAGDLAQRRPVHLEGDPIPRIREGTLSLNDPARAQAWLATFSVGSGLEEILDR